MPKTQKTTAEPNSTAAKKAAVLNDVRKGRVYIILISLVIIAMGAGMAAYVGFAKLNPGSPASAVGPHQTADASSVYHPVSLFDDGQARHFDFDTGHRTIRYFVLKSSDGVIRAAFDACDVCWPAGKGYYQEGDVMVCRNCGRRFHSNRINDVKGGCNPAPLTRSVHGDRLVIQVDHILEGESYFDFSKRG